LRENPDFRSNKTPSNPALALTSGLSSPGCAEFMPEHVLLFRVFVAAPSDVDEEHEIIRGQIDLLKKHFASIWRQQ